MKINMKIDMKIDKVNSVQEAFAKGFTVHLLKFEVCIANHKKKWNKEQRLLVFSLSSINLTCWCFLFCFFMWFKRVQIYICEPQSIWRTMYGVSLSWLYENWYVYENQSENWYENWITCVVGLVERLGGLGVSRDILQKLE